MDRLVPDLRLRRRCELLAAGFTDGELQRMRRTGVVTPVRRGVYVPAGDERLATPEDRHALRVAATMPRLAAGAVASHVSAAVLHGLPVWGIPLDRVHVTRDGTGGGRLRTGLHVHVAPLKPGEVVDVGGLAVTSAARTVVDLARTGSFEQAVAVADAALHAERASAADLVAAQVRAARWPGGPQAMRVVRFTDGRADGVGESRSRVAIAAAGLPAPDLQYVVLTADGRFVAKVDFAWLAHRTVGEFDGRVKYGRLLRPGQTAGDAVYEEKLREDAVRAQDLAMERWGWSDLDHFGGVAARLRRRFGLA